MELITKDHRKYHCKLVDFTHGNETHENEVEIKLTDDTVEYEELTNIAYINY